MKKLALTGALAASTVLAGALPAMAEYPTSPVQFVVPFPPGDFEDILTRDDCSQHARSNRRFGVGCE